jgi:hypothetical protein
VDTVEVWGYKWDIWRGGNSGGWEVFSFVNQQNIWSVDNKNLNDFFDVLWSQKNWVDGRRYIVGI